jgi:hypothetical protein
MRCRREIKEPNLKRSDWHLNLELIGLWACFSEFSLYWPTGCRFFPDTPLGVINPQQPCNPPNHRSPMGSQFGLHPSHSVTPQLENPGKKPDQLITATCRRKSLSALSKHKPLAASDRRAFKEVLIRFTHIQYALTETQLKLNSHYMTRSFKSWPWLCAKSCRCWISLQYRDSCRGHDGSFVTTEEWTVVISDIGAQTRILQCVLLILLHSSIILYATVDV